jgi:hypothetical protein
MNVVLITALAAFRISAYPVLPGPTRPTITAHPGPGKWALLSAPWLPIRPVIDCAIS